MLAILLDEALQDGEPPLGALAQSLDLLGDGAQDLEQLDVLLRAGQGLELLEPPWGRDGRVGVAPVAVGHLGLFPAKEEAHFRFLLYFRFSIPNDLDEVAHDGRRLEAVVRPLVALRVVLGLLVLAVAGVVVDVHGGRG